jgi:hypothetical protein
MVMGKELQLKNLGLSSVLWQHNILQENGSVHSTGKIKFNNQWKLNCLVHNIEKIMNYGESFSMAEKDRPKVPIWG